jgi:hypothetical protein
VSRTIYTSNGRTDYAEMTLIDAKGHDLSAATITLGLSTDPNTPPIAWFPPDLATYPSVGKAVLSLLLNSTRAPAGSYWLWALIVDNPTTQPVRAFNIDGDGRIVTL